MCNKATLGVFQNLYNALAQLQELGWVSMPIWIDAISINQYDDMEKSAQVRMMGDIFRNASRVIVWLGRSSMATELAVKKVQELCAGEELPDLYDNNSRIKLSILSRAILIINALRWVLLRGWFARVWTLQEAVLARETVYLIGAQIIPFDQILELGLAHWAETGSTGGLTRTQMRVASLNFARAAHELLVVDGGVCTFETALKETRKRRSADGRDKLFGVLALCQRHDSGNALDVVADYQKSVQDVFYEAAAAMLRSEKTGIYLLSLVGQIRHGADVEYAFNSSFIKLFKPENGFVTDLPSWVPDLSAPTRPAPLRDMVPRVEFSAALSLRPSFSISGNTGRCLELKAAVLDTIATTGDCLPSRLITNVWRLLRLPLKLPNFPMDIYLPTGEPVVSAFWRTLVAGATHTGHNDDKQAVELTDSHFAEWFARLPEGKYCISTSEMFRSVLQERKDDDDVDLAAEPDDRHHMTPLDYIAHYTDLRRLDRYKIHAIRKFLTAFDSPAYGFREAMERRRERVKAMNQAESVEDLINQADSPFDDMFGQLYVDRRMFISEKGYLGTAPWTAVEGDTIMLVAGGYVPYVFRRSDRREEAWQLIGEAYCRGFMCGEGMEMEGIKFKTVKVI